MKFWLLDWRKLGDCAIFFVTVEREFDKVYLHQEEQDTSNLERYQDCSLRAPQTPRGVVRGNTAKS